MNTEAWLTRKRFRSRHPFASRYYAIRRAYADRGVRLPPSWATIEDFELWARDVVHMGTGDILTSPNDGLVSPTNFTFITNGARVARSGGQEKKRQIIMESKYRFDAEGWKKQVREALDAKPNGLDPEAVKKNGEWREAIREALHAVEED